MVEERFLPEAEEEFTFPAKYPFNAGEFLLCVDYVDGQPAGSLLNFFSPEAVPFVGWGEAILHMDAIMDDLRHPQSDTDHRRFSAVRLARRPAVPTPEQRRAEEQLPPPPAPHPVLAGSARARRFCVRILYRQHSSWQGEVTWLNSKKPDNQSKRCFRSALELMGLLQSAMPGQG